MYLKRKKLFHGCNIHTDDMKFEKVYYLKAETASCYFTCLYSIPKLLRFFHSGGGIFSGMLMRRDNQRSPRCHKIACQHPGNRKSEKFCPIQEYPKKKAISHIYAKQIRLAKLWWERVGIIPQSNKTPHNHPATSAGHFSLQKYYFKIHTHIKIAQNSGVRWRIFRNYYILH